MDLPTNVSEDVRRLNPGVFQDALSFVTNAVKESKYHAVRTGRYHSRKEARYADELEQRKRAGEISFYLEQVPFRLPGDIIYRLDFMTFTEKRNYSPSKEVWFDVRYIEVKGKDLYAGRIKRKQTESIYGIHIEVV